MNKKIPILSILIVLLFTLSTYSPVISANKYMENQEKIEIEINNYLFGSLKQNTKKLTEEEIKDLIQILDNYEKALKEDNIKQITKCEQWLKNKDVLNENQIKILTLLDNYQSSSTVSLNGNLSESNCIFSASGEGFMYFPMETQIIEWIEEQAREQENAIAGFVLMLLLIILFYIPVMLATHVVPFRIAMPHAQLTLESGAMKVADKTISTPIKVNLTSFTGITISTPKISVGNETENNNESNGYLFVKGYAGKVEEVADKI